MVLQSVCKTGSVSKDKALNSTCDAMQCNATTSTELQWSYYSTLNDGTKSISRAIWLDKFKSHQRLVPMAHSCLLVPLLYVAAPSQNTDPILTAALMQQNLLGAQ